MRVEEWQESAWSEWFDKMERPLSPAVRAMVSGLERGTRAEWLLRLRRPASPVASTLADWLAGSADRRWVLVPWLRWDRVETDAGTLVAYPEPLGGDPLAMAGAALVVSGFEPERLVRVVERLGAAVLPAAAAAGLGEAAVLWPGYARAYAGHWRQLDGDRLQRLFDRGTGSSWSFDWPAVPAFETYRDQLEAGVVPHDPDGRSPADRVAVLLALHGMRGAARLETAGLAYKALEGAWLAEAWDRYGKGAE